MINHCDDDRVLDRALLLASTLLLLAFAAFAQKPELTPTVKVRPASSTPAQSSDCTTGLVPAPPRLEIEPARPAEMPHAVERATAASHDTASHFRRVQDAAEADDRTSFKAALESARSASRSLEPGPQRTRAEELLKVYDDIERVWDFAFASPTGSFFSAETQGGSLLAALSRYSGYTDFIRKESLVDQLHERFYPTRETRLFLTSLAGRLLLGARLGPAAAAPVTARKPERNGPSAGTSGMSQRQRIASSDRGAHHRSSATKPSRPSSAHRSAPKSASHAGRSTEGSRSSPNSVRKNEPGRKSIGSGAGRSLPAITASAGRPRGGSGRRSSKVTPEKPASSTPAQKAAQPGSSQATRRIEPSTSSAPAPVAAVATSSPPPATPFSTSSTASASAAPFSSTSAPNDTSGATSSAASGTTATEITASSSPVPPTSEPAVPSGGRTYLSILMVAIGLIVLIVLIRASK